MMEKDLHISVTMPAIEVHMQHLILLEDCCLLNLQNQIPLKLLQQYRVQWSTDVLNYSYSILKGNSKEI
jgi:hypothetical protein